jgi:hypothetical protein
MKLEEEMNAGNWEEAAWRVAQDHGIEKRVRSNDDELRSGQW